MGQHSFYNHVVVFWRGNIINFETSQLYPLTRVNVGRICGSKNPFHKISQGYVILPSKKRKYSVGDVSDWGEKEIHESAAHLLQW